MTEDTAELSPWGERWRLEYEAQKEKQRQGRPPRQSRPKMTPEQKSQVQRESSKRYKDRKRQERDRGEYVPPVRQTTHCPAGHEYDEQNTYVSPSGSRRCRICRRRQKRDRESQRAAEQKYLERKRQELKDKGEYKPPRAERTHCPVGHPYDEENTYKNPQTGHRRCRKCHNEQVKAEYARNPEPALRRRREQFERDGDKWNVRKREERQLDGDRVRAQDRANYQANPGRKRKLIYVRRTGILWSDWEAMWNRQEGRCYLCGDALPLPPEDGVRPAGAAGTPHLDHDHRCCPGTRSCPLCRRGLACNRCNALIGMADDDPQRLRRIADALEVANRAVEVRRSDSGPVELAEARSN